MTGNQMHGKTSSVRAALVVAGLGVPIIIANAATGGDDFFYIIGGALVFLGLSVAGAVGVLFR